ncbi:TIGR04279 domain-containing protein, partial [Candidatus Bathyarchaeota archaeon]|nr:TIGR04279 domain-containing protein [Candidatus Bathyarchaeota archaeon]
MRIKRATTVATIILALAMMNIPGLLGPIGGFGVAQGQPSSLYPVVVTVDGETIFIATHTSDLTSGNWIELSGGTEIKLPSLTLAYEGLASTTYDGDVATVTIESSFAEDETTYPLDTHHVYSTGQTIPATFWGSSALASTAVDFKLISISSIAEAKDIFSDAFQGDLDPLQNKLDNPTWSETKTLSGTGDATVTISSQSVGNYLLVVVKEPTDELYIYSATVVAVVDQTLDVTCPSSVERGNSLTVNTGLTGLTYIHGAVLIKETAYSCEVKLVTEGTVLSTELQLNEVKMADEAFVTESLSYANVVLLLEQLRTAFSSNQMAIGANLISGSISLSTSSLTSGDYVLIVGVYNILNSRIVGVYQKTVRVTSPIVGSINNPPVAEAGPDQSAWVRESVYFDGSDSYDPDGYLVCWDWSFGDGATASGEKVSHEYSEPGNYTVTLTVKDIREAVASDTCTVEISEPPAPVSDKYSEQVASGEAGYVVDAADEANTTVTLDTIAPVTVTVLKYEGNPHPEDPLPATALPNYVDVEVSDPDAVVWPIYVEMFYTDEEVMGLDESTFGIYYWFNGTWQRCS